MRQRDKIASGAKKKTNARKTGKKTPVKKTAAKATAKTKSVFAVTAEQRHRMVSEAAFYISKRRGAHHDSLRNWVEAEAEINMIMSKSP